LVKIRFVPSTLFKLWPPKIEILAKIRLLHSAWTFPTINVCANSMHSKLKLEMAGLNHSVIETLYGSYSTLGGKSKQEWKEIIYNRVRKIVTVQYGVMVQILIICPHFIEFISETGQRQYVRLG